MVKRTFDPGFRIELHQKDLNLALNSARSLGVALPNTATAQELFNSCSAHGGKAWDHSAMVRALEMMANFVSRAEVLTQALAVFQNSSQIVSEMTNRSRDELFLSTGDMRRANFIKTAMTDLEVATMLQCTMKKIS
jgi:hypothetical protein